MDYFSKVGVNVISLRGRTEFLSNIHATGEHTLALSLALLRKVPQAQAGVGRGEWNRYDYKGRELFGKRVFLLGYGRLGRQVAGLFSAFGCDVRAYDIDRGKVPEPMFVALEEGLAAADIVSLHVSLDETTQGLLTSDLLRRMKPDALFINTARGELLDQNALLDMLEEGRLAGAALDVLLSEPDPMDDRLKKLMGDPRINLVITPHIGGFTVESLQAVELYAASLLLAELGLLAGPA
jgi:D-3-phosphoglycerate dehydrogenase